VDIGQHRFGEEAAAVTVPFTVTLVPSALSS